MNAIELLKAEHVRIEKLLEEVDSTEELSDRKRVFQEVKQELEVHCHIEETEFYPQFRKNPGMEDMVEDSLDDHQEIRMLLDEISEIDEDEDFDDRFSELIDAVQAHVEFEENEFFPEVEKRMSSADLERIGAALEQEKRSVQTAA